MLLHLQAAEGQLDLLAKLLWIGRRGLGRDDQTLATPLDGQANALLAAAIAVGGVDQVDARVQRGAHDGDGLRGGEALDRDAAETQRRDHQAGAAQPDLVHREPPAGYELALPDVPNTSRK